MFPWFATHQHVYWGIAWTAFALLTSLALLPLLHLADERKATRLLRSDLLFHLCLALGLWAFRWPALLIQHELNTDESQLIAGAITLARNPVFWDSVNGTTSGPLNFYALFFTRVLGLPFDYFAARLVGLALVATAIGATFQLLQRRHGDAARIGVLPLWCVFAFATFPDLVHYSSEHVTIALLALGLCSCSNAMGTPQPASRFSWPLFIGALLFGAAPWAKLQSGPIAAVALLTVAFVMLRQTTGWPDRRRRAMELFVGAALPSLVIGCLALGTGVWTDAWNTYFLQNVVYAGNRAPFSFMLARFWTFTAATDNVHPYLVGATAFLVVTAPWMRFFRKSDRPHLVLAGTTSAAAWCAVAAPGNHFGHYLLLLVVPVGTLLGLLWGAWWHQEGGFRWVWNHRFIAALAFAALGLAPQVLHRAATANPHLTDPTAATPVLGAVARVILQHAKPGEPLGQWGWMPRFHVETQLPQAAREAHTYFQMAEGPLIAYFRSTYLEAFQRNVPPVFVDAIGSGSFMITDRNFAHESFPPLAELIRRHYTLVADLDGARIYVLNHRLSAATANNGTPAR